MAKKPFSLDSLETKIQSDRTLTSEDEAREQFWTPTALKQPPIAAPQKTIANKRNKDNYFSISQEDQIVHLDISLIDPDPAQPRKHFSAEALEDLKNSIQERGVQQPITVRSTAGGRYMIVIGERRWRSCADLGLPTVPAIVRAMTDSDAYLSAVTENVQREDLHYLDEAAAYREMLDRGYVKTQSEIAEKIGVHKARLSERLKLLSLPEPVKAVIYDTPAITPTHAIRLAKVEDNDFNLYLAKKIAKENITIEKLDALIKGKTQPRRRKSSFKAVHLTQRATGFDLLIKFRADRPQDCAEIIEIMLNKISELGGGDHLAGGKGQKFA